MENIKAAVQDMSKEEMKDVLNTVLDTDIAFDKLSQKDLQKLFVVIMSNPLELGRKITSARVKSRLAEIGNMVDKISHEGVFGLGLLRKRS